MSQTPPPPTEPVADLPDLGPSRLRARRRRQPNLFVRRALFIGVLCLVTAGVGLGAGKLFKGAFAPAAPTPATAAAPIDNQLNVLVVGVDPTPLPAAPGDKATRRVADTLHVISIDTKRQRAFVLSIPRQTFVLLGNTGPGTLSDALAVGEMPMLQEAIENITGLTIHHHVAIDVDGLKKLFGEMGDAEVFLPDPIAGQDVPSQLSLEAKPGWHTLKPEQALALAWLRPEGDELVRLERQQMIMQHWLERSHELFAWWWLPGVIARSQDDVTTDLPKADYEQTMRQLADLAPDRVAYAILPGEVSPQGTWLPATKRLDALMARMVVAPQEKPNSELKPTIELLYNDPDDEKVMNLASALTNQGFQVVRTARYAVPQFETRLIDRTKVEERSQSAIDALTKAAHGARVMLATDEINAYGATYTLQLGKAFFRE